MIYIKIQKIKLLDILIENGMPISYKSINSIYEFIQRTNQNINFESFQDLKKKIHTSLCSLKKSFEKVKRKKTRRDIENFKLKCSKEFFEFHLTPICIYDQPSVETLSERLCIEKPQLDILFENLQL